MARKPDGTDPTHAQPPAEPTRVAKFTADSDSPRYRLIDRLGVGGMGEVWRAEDAVLKRTVALKLIREDYAQAEDVQERFLREARTAAGLRSDHIVPVFDFGYFQRRLFLSMPLLEGETLEDRLKRGDRLSPREVARVGLETALGLQKAHDFGVVHRDVKPSNIFLEDPDGKVVLLDFGIAKSTADGPLTKTGDAVGTYRFMSPEQLRAKEGLDGRSDLFSLGAVLYLTAVGSHPFGGDTLFEVMEAINGHHPHPPDALKNSIPGPLSELIMWLLAKDPDDRPRSAAEVVAALRAISLELPTLPDHSIPALTAWGNDGTEEMLADSGPTDPYHEPSTGTRAAWMAPTANERRRTRLIPALIGAAAFVIVIGLAIGSSIIPRPADPEPEPPGPDPAVTVKPGETKSGKPELVGPVKLNTREQGPDLDAVERFEWRGETRTRRVRTVDLGGGETLALVRIPKGSFPFGSADSDPDAEADEKPQHPAELTEDFYIGMHEVTRGQFARFVAETGYETEAEGGRGGYGFNAGAGEFDSDPKYTWRSPGFEQTDAHPVVMVTWNDATAFCAWAGTKTGLDVRLPTEAGWESACRAGTPTRYFTGDDAETLGGYANIADAAAKAKYGNWKTVGFDDGFVFTSPAGHFEPNGFGLYDMSGNVWEWCADAYDPDLHTPGAKAGPVGSAKAYRGGGWYRDPAESRSANRDKIAPSSRSCFLGFRVAVLP